MNYIAYLNCFLLLYTAFVGQKDCNRKKDSNNKLSFLTPFTVGKKWLEKPLEPVKHPWRNFLDVRHGSKYTSA